MGRKTNHTIKTCKEAAGPLAFVLALPVFIIKGIIDLFSSIGKKGNDVERLLNNLEKNRQNINTDFSNSNKNNIIHTKYDDYFTYIIRQRGNDYYQRNLVSDLKKDNDTYTAVVSGTSNYKVNFKIDNKGIRDMDCECPYFQSGEGNCKHLYAAILKYQNSNFVNESNTTNPTNFNILVDLISQMEELIDEATDLYNDNDILEDLYFELEEFEENINQYKELKFKNLSDVVISEAQNDYDQMENIYQEMQDVLEDLEEDKPINEYTSESENEKSWLEDYEPYNFEEEDLEEDDYYFEDDD